MRIARTFIIASIAVALWACGKDDSVVPDQQDVIRAFLDGNELEYDVQGGVYRHFGARGIVEAPTLENGDQVGFMFELYPARYTYATTSLSRLSPVPTTAIFTNKQGVIDTLMRANANFDPAWPTDPFVARVGSEALIEGLNRGLAGCREGDSVLLFITSDLALGDKMTGTVAANTALLYVINIKTVSKQ